MLKNILYMYAFKVEGSSLKYLNKEKLQFGAKLKNRNLSKTYLTISL